MPMRYIQQYDCDQKGCECTTMTENGSAEGWLSASLADYGRDSVDYTQAWLCPDHATKLKAITNRMNFKNGRDHF